MAAGSRCRPPRARTPRPTTDRRYRRESPAREPERAPGGETAVKRSKRVVNLQCASQHAHLVVKRSLRLQCPRHTCSTDSAPGQSVYTPRLAARRSRARGVLTACRSREAAAGCPAKRYVTCVAYVAYVARAACVTCVKSVTYGDHGGLRLVALPKSTSRV